MDSRRFDSLAQRFATSMNRRSILRDGFVAAAAVLAGARRHSTLAQAPCAFAQVDCFFNQICVDGLCEDCPEGLAPCQTYCADLLSDPENCLFCGNQCASGVCERSQCLENAGCDPGLTECGGQCVNLLTDVNNCGVCGGVCAGVSGPGFESAGQCVQGQCVTVCSPGADECDGECTDLTADSLNCGACGNRCIVGAVCCAGRCVLENSAERFCEECGALEGWPQGCNEDKSCERGLCIEEPPCEEGLTECGEAVCADLLTDPLNCGICGNACLSNECGGGNCLPPAEFADEPDAITYLLFLEQVNQTLIESGLATESLDLDETTNAFLGSMLQHDNSHISTLQRMVRDRGSEIPEDETPSIAIPNTSTLYLTRLGRVKELSVSAYADVVERVPSLAGAGGVSLIMTVEARHATYLAMQVGNDPFAGATELIVSRPEVLTEVEALWRG